jgi:uncharacterized protein (TIGR02453 family)
MPRKTTSASPKQSAMNASEALDSRALQQFLSELRDNNTKDWFDANKPHYEALRKQFSALVEEVIAATGHFDASVRQMTAKETMFRINRDVRFSKDKAPYKTQFSAALCPEGKKTGMPAYYFQIDHRGAMYVGGGVYMPEPQQLSRLRENIAATPEQIETVLKHKEFKRVYGDLDRSMSLVKLPKGYYDDVAHPDLIKLKGFFAGCELDAKDITGGLADILAETITSYFHALHPLVVWLRGAMS